ncbi:MAG TPA: RyR domain-containing protein [Pseudolysinimonas sp.]|nr:RyR domain-containing protein [Pseudolysinimonas sp.]
MIGRLVCLVASLLFAISVGLLALAVYVPLPGVLGAWNDPAAGFPVTVSVLLGAVAFGAWAWPRRHGDHAFSLVFLGLGTAVVLVLGTAGYLRCIDPAQSAGWSVLSRVLGFLLNGYDVAMFEGGECGPGVPLALQFARLVQLTVLVVAASRALAALLRGQVDRVRVRLARSIQLVVGADEDSAVLLAPLAAERGIALPVVVTSDAGAAWVRRARAQGWRIVAGDATHPELLAPLLRRGQSRHALTGLAVLPADSTAAQRLVRSVEQALAGRTGAPVRALVRIDEAWQAEDWRRRYLSRAGEWAVDTLSIDEVTARLVVEDALRAGVDRIVVVGHSGLTFAVLAELAQQSREAGLLGAPAAPGVVVLDPEADDVLEQHAFSQRRFGNTSGVQASAAAEQPGPASIARAVAGATAPAIIFAGDPDERLQRLAAVLGAESPDWVLYSRQSGVAGLGREPLLARVHAFGSTLDAGGRPIGAWERVARLGHERFIREHPDPAIASRRPWDELAPFYRISNLRQVMSTLGNAVAVGRSWGAGAAAVGMPSDEQLERMARREHDSWSAHLAANGWRYGDGRDDARRRHPDLRPWDELDEEARDKTRAGVRSSLELLATLGYRSFDDTSADWRTYHRHGVVWARRRDEGWEWSTASGQTLRGAPGDWEVYDKRGHAHAVAPAAFASSHRHLEGDRYERTGSVQVRPARPGEVIETLEGPLVAGEGEWVVRGDLGEEWIITGERLRSGYRAGPG